MLVLTRKKGQSIIIHDNIEITVLDVEGENIKIGISAPREVQVIRKELLVSVKETNQESVGLTINMQNLSNELKKIKKNL